MVSGERAYQYVRDLFPFCRSLTGQGVRDTLAYIKGVHPDLRILEFKSGEDVYDWKVPDEWNIRGGYIEDLEGVRYVDFRDNNLHVVGYSEPVNQVMSFKELDANLYSLPSQPEAIPYVASYYKRRWGFCLSDALRRKMAEEPDKQYRVVVDSTLESGVMQLGEVFIPGELEDEVVLSTYICHPSMANNELSGPAVAMELLSWLKSLDRRRYSYRVLFLVETIGALAYLSRNLDWMRRRVKAGFVLTCIGDDGDYSVVQSRYADNYADRVAIAVMDSGFPGYKRYSFLQNGSDERQYCSPGVDLPFVTLCRTKFAEYSEYHTSLDNLDFVSPSGLQGGLDLVRKCIELVELNKVYQTLFVGEPQLGKRGLYPSLSTLESERVIRAMMSFLSYADGGNDLIDIANITGLSLEDLYVEAKKLAVAGVVREV